MNAHPVRLDTPAALIELATRVYGRITRLAIRSTQHNRLRIMGELALTDTVLDQVELEVRLIEAPRQRRALPQARRALPRRTA